KVWGHGSHRTLGTGNNEWYTPATYIDAARDVLGKIDLDPASSERAQAVVKAERYFTADDDGLDSNWFGNVWLNPPYSRDLLPSFVDKLVCEVREGNVEQAIMLTHNFSDTAWFHNAAEIADSICFTRGRIDFYNET